MARIVIAEDDAHILRIMVMWLTRHGHEVFESRNGSVALENVRRYRPDILITDVNMPRMSGTELAQTSLAELPEPFFVFVFTSRCDRSAVLAALPADRARVCPKPFSPAKLVDEINKVLSGRKQEVVT